MAKKKPAKKQTTKKPAVVGFVVVRVKGAPTEPGDYRLMQYKSNDLMLDDPYRAVVHTVDKVDDVYLYGVPGGFFGRAEFKIERSTVMWHERLPVSIEPPESTGTGDGGSCGPCSDDSDSCE